MKAEIKSEITAAQNQE